MPATAGRVRMPHNNRMHTTGALQTSSRWRNVVGFDPHASNEEAQMMAEKHASQQRKIEQFKEVMELSRLSGGTAHTQNRGGCKTCGAMGHLTFQCRAHLGSKRDDLEDVETDDEEDDSDSGSDSEKASVSSVNTADLEAELAREAGRSRRKSRSHSDTRGGKRKKRSRSRSRSRSRKDGGGRREKKKEKREKRVKKDKKEKMRKKKRSKEGRSRSRERGQELKRLLSATAAVRARVGE